MKKPLAALRSGHERAKRISAPKKHVTLKPERQHRSLCEMMGGIRSCGPLWYAAAHAAQRAFFNNNRALGRSFFTPQGAKKLQSGICRELPACRSALMGHRNAKHLRMNGG